MIEAGHLAAALLLAVPAAAAAQPAPWAAAGREPMCIYDGFVSPALDAARMATVRPECMERFGWTEARANRAMRIARLLVDVMGTRQEAIDAGVEAWVIDRVFGSFSRDEVAAIATTSVPVSERARAVNRQLARRLLQRGLDPARSSKAAQAIHSRMFATHAIAEFAREAGD